ncbi:unnamed protein product [Amoebophrya sp. A25]|nr:unnamed protein product [Amoebophrya sp. A25]|eukprot:GSA25T00001662001.1
MTRVPLTKARSQLSDHFNKFKEQIPIELLQLITTSQEMNSSEVVDHQAPEALGQQLQLVEQESAHQEHEVERQSTYCPPQLPHDAQNFPVLHREFKPKVLFLRPTFALLDDEMTGVYVYDRRVNRLARLPFVNKEVAGDQDGDEEQGGSRTVLGQRRCQGSPVVLPAHQQGQTQMTEEQAAYFANYNAEAQAPSGYWTYDQHCDQNGFYFGPQGLPGLHGQAGQEQEMACNKNPFDQVGDHYYARAPCNGVSSWEAEADGPTVDDIAENMTRLNVSAEGEAKLEGKTTSLPPRLRGNSLGAANDETKASTMAKAPNSTSTKKGSTRKGKHVERVAVHPPDASPSTTYDRSSLLMHFDWINRLQAADQAELQYLRERVKQLTNLAEQEDGEIGDDTTGSPAQEPMKIRAGMENIRLPPGLEMRASLGAIESLRRAGGNTDVRTSRAEGSSSSTEHNTPSGSPSCYTTAREEATSGSGGLGSSVQSSPSLVPGEAALSMEEVDEESLGGGESLGEANAEDWNNTSGRWRKCVWKEKTKPEEQKVDHGVLSSPATSSSKKKAEAEEKATKKADEASSKKSRGKAKEEQSLKKLLAKVAALEAENKSMEKELANTKKERSTLSRKVNDTSDNYDAKAAEAWGWQKEAYHKEKVIKQKQEIIDRLRTDLSRAKAAATWRREK